MLDLCQCFLFSGKRFLSDIQQSRRQVTNSLAYIILILLFKSLNKSDGNKSVFVNQNQTKPLYMSLHCCSQCDIQFSCSQ